MKAFLLFASLSFAFISYSSGQILCINCYDQNDSISSGVTNLMANGSFENTDCQPWPGPDMYCPNSTGYSCNLAGWTCTGGGPSTYACTFNSTYVVIPDGNLAAYFGNSYCNACSTISGDTSCFINEDCGVTGFPAGYPNNYPSYGGAAGVSLQQTVTGLTPGNIYVLEFWAGGEWSYSHDGVFALDVGFGDTLLRNPTTGVGQIGREYVVQFVASSTSHTIKFTNWGHVCNDCTELVLDQVKLYTLAQLSSTVAPCGSLSSISSFAASDTDVCEKFCVDFTDQSTNSPTSWQWSFQGGTPSTSTDQNPTNICYQTPGVFDVTLITSNSGGSDTLTLPGYITVYGTPPFPVITQTGYTLTSSAASSYQWQLNGQDIPGATNQSYDVLQTGLYSVFITDEHGCGSSANVYVTISGFQDLPADFNFSVYPNPSDGNFIIDLSNASGLSSSSLQIMNTLGQIVFSSEENISSDKFKKEIKLPQASKGVYFIEIKNSDFDIKKKIVLMK